LSRFQRRLGGFQTGVPRASRSVSQPPKLLALEVVVPVGAEDDQIEAIEARARNVPATRLHHRVSALEGSLDERVAG